MASPAIPGPGPASGGRGRCQGAVSGEAPETAGSKLETEASMRFGSQLWLLAGKSQGADGASPWKGARQDVRQRH